VGRGAWVLRPVLRRDRGDQPKRRRRASLRGAFAQARPLAIRAPPP